MQFSPRGCAKGHFVINIFKNQMSGVGVGLVVVYGVMLEGEHGRCCGILGLYFCLFLEFGGCWIDGG